MVEGVARASVVSVNVGVPRGHTWHGRVVTTAIWKEPVIGPVRVQGVNLHGDDQADRRVHGGPDKAVYACAVEHHAQWQADGFEVVSGSLGENLAVRGVTETDVRIGDRWRWGAALPRGPSGPRWARPGRLSSYWPSPYWPSPYWPSPGWPGHGVVLGAECHVVSSRIRRPGTWTAKAFPALWSTARLR